MGEGREAWNTEASKAGNEEEPQEWKVLSWSQGFSELGTPKRSGKVCLPISHLKNRRGVHLFSHSALARWLVLCVNLTGTQDAQILGQSYSVSLRVFIDERSI